MKTVGLKQMARAVYIKEAKEKGMGTRDARKYAREKMTHGKAELKAKVRA